MFKETLTMPERTSVKKEYQEVVKKSPFDMDYLELMMNFAAQDLHISNLQEYNFAQIKIIDNIAKELIACGQVDINSAEMKAADIWIDSGGSAEFKKKYRKNF